MSVPYVDNAPIMFILLIECINIFVRVFVHPHRTHYAFGNVHECFFLLKSIQTWSKRNDSFVEVNTLLMNDCFVCINAHYKTQTILERECEFKSSKWE